MGSQSSVGYCIVEYYSFVVQPEGEPGHHHDHEAGHVDGHDVEGELPGKHQVHPQAAVFTYKYWQIVSASCGTRYAF